MTKVFDPHIELIRTAVAAIEQYRPADKATFIASPMTQDAILMRLQEIGENLARMRQIDEEAFVATADDTWLQLIGLRNVISHGYHTVKRETIWLMITEELPALTSSLDALLDC